ncbi:MAG: F0F1 ATP synthase subunit B [Propionibacteriaceae bacterium]|jgi:F-type H+-transporting ATPase subunit b|nr:F0F1 ATP synthase subunit B [Propionibacteriaceae bacterium]
MFPLEGSSGPLGPLLPEHLSEFVVGLVLFAVIWVVMAKKIVPAFEAVYKRRDELIRGGIEESERKQAEADAALARYNAQLAKAADEAAGIREEARDSAAQIRTKARRQAEAEAERVIAAARAQIGAERVQAASELRGEIGGLATDLAGKILGETLADEQRASRAVDRFLAELDQLPVKA